MTSVRCSLSFPSSVRIVEVGPRDGLQNEKTVVPTAERIALINGLRQAGLRHVEVGSFVSPKWVPQMADTPQVLAALPPMADGRYAVLVPNERGMDAAEACPNIGEIAIFAAASESFSHKNINCSIAESLERFAPVVARAQANGWVVRGYVSCVMGCPYEGDVPVQRVAEVAAALYRMGCYEISLGDTVGVGTPRLAKGMIEAVAAEVPVTALAAHFHDTYGQALANLLAVLELGVAVIDSSVAGLGGCPYAAGAAGNVATEDVVYMLHGMGIETGLDLTALAVVGQRISDVIGRPTGSKVARAVLARGA